MINWPESLVLELAERRGIIFLGAGASATAKRPEEPVARPPLWQGFLEVLRAAARRGTQEDLELVDRLIADAKYLDAAQVLRSTCLFASDYNRVVGESFERFNPTEVHRMVDVLDQRIVVTTNFDTLYEDHCRQGDARHAYAVLHYYDAGLIARLRSPKRLILKVHGSISTPEQTVLSRSDYFRARADHAGFYKTLESVFLSHTLLFLGYGISDPDVQLLLENGLITAPSDHPHYALMAKGMHPALKSAFKDTYNIEILEYDPADGHAEFFESLQGLVEAVEVLRDPLP